MRGIASDSMVACTPQARHGRQRLHKADPVDDRDHDDDDARDIPPMLEEGRRPHAEIAATQPLFKKADDPTLR